MLRSKLLLPLFFLLLLLPAQADAAAVFSSERECFEALGSERFCAEAFSSGAREVSEEDVFRLARESAGEPGGDFSDPVWLNPGIAAGADDFNIENPLTKAAGLLLLAGFFLLLFDWRRPARRAHLDLLFLTLSFLLAFAVFLLGYIDLSIWMNIAILLILLLRMIWFSRGKSEGLSPSAPTKVFLFAIAFLLVFRILVTFLFGSYYDVGFAGMVGAKLLLAGEAIYGNFPAIMNGGDTYPPLNYYSYIPFQILLPVEGVVSEGYVSLGARLHAIFFALASAVTLFLIGGAISGKRWMENRLGIILLFAYLAFPITAFSLLITTNNSLMVFLSLLSFYFLLKSKGSLSAISLAGSVMSKFVSGFLAPLFSRPLHSSSWKEDRAHILRFILVFIFVISLLMLPTIISPGLLTFWQETFLIQSTRISPFSLWGQLGGISPTPFLLLLAGLSLLGFFWPNRKPALLAAWAAALLIGVQFAQPYWFYTYFIWSFPFLMIALLAWRQRS